VSKDVRTSIRKYHSAKTVCSSTVYYTAGEIWAKNWHFLKVLNLPLCLTNLGKI